MRLILSALVAALTCSSACADDWSTIMRHEADIADLKARVAKLEAIADKTQRLCEEIKLRFDAPTGVVIPPIRAAAPPAIREAGEAIYVPAAPRVVYQAAPARVYSAPIMVGDDCGAAFAGFTAAGPAEAVCGPGGCSVPQGMSYSYSRGPFGGTRVRVR